MLGACAVHAQGAKDGHALDPAAWGGSHVGQPAPIYEDGNTCLFCHRTSIGHGWQTNKHATTMRAFVDEPEAATLKEKADGAELVLGRTGRLRFLKPTKAYGTLALLDAAWSPAEKSWSGNSAWSDGKFAAKCAGCHASAVDTAAKTFQTPSLDCHTCHGLAVPEHTQDGALMLLSAKGPTRPEVEISICGSCHLRGGKSKSSGLPYPNNFVPGDNLFKDYEFDLSDARIRSENPIDAHIVQNVRNVALFGRKNVSCGTCHEVHKESSKKHTKVAEQALCFTCHIQGKPMKTMRRYERHNATCEY